VVPRRFRAGSGGLVEKDALAYDDSLGRSVAFDAFRCTTCVGRTEDFEGRGLLAQ
jgi:hypothetical protein